MNNVPKFSGTSSSGWFDDLLKTVQTAAPIAIQGYEIDQQQQAKKKLPPGCVNGFTDSSCADQLAAQYHAAEQAGATDAELLQIAQAALQKLSEPWLGGDTKYQTEAKAVFAHAVSVLQPKVAATAPTGSITESLTSNNNLLIFGAIGIIGFLLLRR